MYCRAQYPGVFFLSLGVTETPFALDCEGFGPQRCAHMKTPNLDGSAYIVRMSGGLPRLRPFGAFWGPPEVFSLGSPLSCVSPYGYFSDGHDGAWCSQPMRIGFTCTLRIAQF